MSYAPASRPRRLRDQVMSMQAVENTADLGACFFLVLTAGTQMLRRLEPGPDLAIGEASQAMFSVHDRLE